MKSIFLAVASVLFAFSYALPEEPKQTPTEVVTKGLKLLTEKKFDEFYDSHCHQYLRKQVSRDDFVKSMGGPRGVVTLELYENVARLIKSKAGTDDLIQRKQEAEDEFEFILVKVKANPTKEMQQWHLELKIEDREWKLMDTD